VEPQWPPSEEEQAEAKRRDTVFLMELWEWLFRNPVARRHEDAGARGSSVKPQR